MNLYDLSHPSKKKKQQLIKESRLAEFAPPGGDDGGPDEDEILFKLAKQWWLGSEQDMIRAERTLASMGWEIGEDEGSYDDGGVFVVRAGDVNGKSYQSWPHEELSLDEGAPISGDGGAVDNFKQQMANNTELAYQKKQQGMTEGDTVVKHRIGLTVTDPNHPMVSKRNEPIQKTVRVPGDDPAKAINAAIAHYRRKGYKVHDHHYMGTVEHNVMDEAAPGWLRHTAGAATGALAGVGASFPGAAIAGPIGGAVAGAYGAKAGYDLGAGAADWVYDKVTGKKVPADKAEVDEELTMKHQRDHDTQRRPDISNSLADRDFDMSEKPNVAKSADGHPTVKWRHHGHAGHTRVEPTLKPTTVQRKDTRPIPSFLKKGMAEGTGDEKFDTMMGQIQREPKYPDSQMPPTDVKDLYQWAIKNNKPYHKIFAEWANREGFKSVAPALMKAGNLDTDALDYWTPRVWKIYWAEVRGIDWEMPPEWAKKRVPDELRDYLETVFDAYDRIVFDWPTEYRQIGGQGNYAEGMAEGVDIGQEWMSDTELDQYVPERLQQQWRELLGYDENGNPSALWANLTGGYEPDVNDPQHRALMVKVANKWFAAKKIPNVKFFNVKDADDELEWLVQIGQQGVAEGGYQHGFADPNAPSLGGSRRKDDEGNSEFDDRQRRQTGMIFYTVDDTELAQQLGLKQTRTGKWYLRTGNRHAQQTADRAFGLGRIWYPKNETVESEELGELSNELLGDYKRELGIRASAADRAGDFDKGHEYFKKINRATIRQGENDARRHAEKENDMMETRLNMMRKAGYDL